MRPQSRKAEICTLDNGLRLVSVRTPGARVEYCGAVVRVGSRDDGDDAPGMAHFIEHTLFKGTERRSSWHIINRMERVGGELNAYTSKEETVVYTAAPAGNLDRAMELLADLMISSRFPAAELEKEREVVSDEINSYLDSPADAIYDDFEELRFAGTPLSHNILGNAEALATFTSDRCREYLHRWYTAPNMVVFYSGPSSADRVASVVAKRFAPLPDHMVGHNYNLHCEGATPFHTTKTLDLHQGHTVMGALVGGMYSPQRYAVDLLANILGGPGMNSLLNVQLREKRGLVYSVEANTSLFTDCGLCTIYFGCDHQDTARCEELVRRQLGALAEKPLTERRLSAAKQQFLGQQYVASDNRENTAIASARSVLYFDSVMSASTLKERIYDIQAPQLQDAAESMIELSTLTFA